MWSDWVSTGYRTENVGDDQINSTKVEQKYVCSFSARCFWFWWFLAIWWLNWSFRRGWSSWTHFLSFSFTYRIYPSSYQQGWCACTFSILKTSKRKHKIGKEKKNNKKPNRCNSNWLLLSGRLPRLESIDSKQQRNFFLLSRYITRLKKNIKQTQENHIFTGFSFLKIVWGSQFMYVHRNISTFVENIAHT